jgi:hypothetical protein
MVVWPCLLILDGDDELIYLSSELALADEVKELILTNDDLIIDTAGVSYSINFVADSLLSTITLVENKQFFTTEQVTDLIRRHEFSKAQVCLTKIYFTSVKEAISSMAYEFR